MKTIARTIAALICLVAFQAQALADNDKPISVSQLPSAAQQILTTHFADKKVALAKTESGLIDRDYDVIFTTGEKIEFDRSGNWKEIDCKQTSVPTALIPTKIANYVNENYADSKILKIEKDDDEYEVKLSVGIEITFNKYFTVTDID